VSGKRGGWRTGSARLVAAAIYAFSVIGGSLPPGVLVRGETHGPSWWPAGTTWGIEGVATTPGTYNFTLAVSDGTSQISENATITISQVVSLDEVQLHNAIEGQAYPGKQLTYALLGGLSGTASFALNSGALPPGMQLTREG
jgi:hypothetical protein